MLLYLRALLPKDGKPFAFKDTYDLGDNWEHEVLFEGVVEPPKKTRLPICIEGERACPPEDCGGEGGCEILDSGGTDYAYRLFVAKPA